jgi:HEAT repeat protein
VFQLAPLRRTLPAALRDLESAKTAVRVSAVRDLAALAAGEQRRSVLGALVGALGSDADPEVRAQAAIALADARAGEYVVQLVDACRDPHPRVRQMALVALGELSPPADGRVRATLLEALSADAPALRFQALIALHHLDGGEAIPEVIRRTSDTDVQVRYIALRILEEHWLEDSQREDPPAAMLEQARRALADSAPKVRLAAAILLARAGDTAGVSQIVAAVNRGEGTEEPEDAQAAVELAGQLKLAGAQAGLARRAFGWFGLFRDQFAFQARVALAQMGDARAVQGILRDLSSWSRDTRTLAVVAAGLAGVGEAAEQIRAMRGDDRCADQEAVEQALAAFREKKE